MKRKRSARVVVPTVAALLLVSLTAVPASAASVRPFWRDTVTRKTVHADNMVMLAQGVLNRFGYFATPSCASYSAAADGYFGACTTTAVKKFQAAHGLNNDGIIGRSTWSALQEGYDTTGSANHLHEIAGRPECNGDQSPVWDSPCYFRASTTYHPRAYTQPARCATSWGAWRFYHIGEDAGLLQSTTSKVCYVET